ncbi:hypothetical protein EJ03DRAFT_372662 [Teratosphaeria nubilosa]|uniref:Ubiquitin-like domain-containing protein n=1 Tax=Teratosphaeria nubilosa TaxID=161662 RepID=A0A6G1LFS2_9PEZI|nr:hypothetical protein EJ03DRAFT_372662 [Teratosphaeria nubilosa]
MASDSEGKAFMDAVAKRLMAKSSAPPNFAAPVSTPVSLRSPELPRAMPSASTRDTTLRENVPPHTSGNLPPAIKVTEPTDAPISMPPLLSSLALAPLSSRDMSLEQPVDRSPSGWSNAEALAEARAFEDSATSAKSKSRTGASRSASRSSDSLRTNRLPPAPNHQAASDSKTPPAPVRPVPSTVAATSRPPPTASPNAWSSFAANSTSKAKQGSDAFTADFSSSNASASSRSNITDRPTILKPPPAVTGSAIPPHLRLKQIATENKLSSSEQQDINTQLQNLDLLDIKGKESDLFDVKERLAELDRRAGIAPKASQLQDAGSDKKIAEKGPLVAKPPTPQASAPPASSGPVTAPLSTSASSLASPPVASNGSALSSLNSAVKSFPAGDTQNLLGIITSLQKELEALKASVTCLEKELHATNVRLEGVSIAHEKRRGAGTEGAKKYFLINTVYPNQKVHQIPVTGDMTVSNFIRRAAFEINRELKQLRHPTLTYAGEQYGHLMTMIECGIKENCEVLLSYQEEDEEEEEL